MANAPLTAFTKLLVLDLEASVTFYKALGFAEIGRDSTFVHLRWQPQGDVFLVPLPKSVKVDGKRGWGVLIGFLAQNPGGVDALATKATALDMPVQGPDNQPWHTREVVITDADGYRLNFIEPANTP
jgi:catechol 2,3-dioxygenase-like lactoylglutathione lyase family enzyme